MTFRDLEIFNTVVSCGNMSLAAKELYVSQPTVSIAISEIEKEYGVRLFERTGKHLVLTPAGEHLRAYVNEILHLNTEMTRFLLTESETPSLRIGATITIGSSLISPVISKLRAVCPEAECDVIIANTAIIQNKLINCLLDVALVEGEINAPELEVIPVVKDELKLICSCRHPFAEKSNISLHELIGEHLIVREEGSGTRAKLENEMISRHLPFHPAWSCYGFDAIIKGIEANLGVTVMSERIVKSQLESGAFHSCSINDVNFKRTFDLVYRKNKFFSSTLTSFVDICMLDPLDINYADS